MAYPVLAEEALKPATPVQTLPPGARVRLLPGSKVKVNNLHGVIRRVITELESYNTLKHCDSCIPLRQPLYEIELDWSKQYRWHSRQVHLSPGQKTIKLFADEFGLVRPILAGPGFRNS